MVKGKTVSEVTETRGEHRPRRRTDVRIVGDNGGIGLTGIEYVGPRLSTAQAEETDCNAGEESRRASMTDGERTRFERGCTNQRRDHDINSFRSETRLTDRNSVSLKF